MFCYLISFAFIALTFTFFYLHFLFYDLTDLKQSTWPDKAVYGATLSVAKDIGQTNSTWWPCHIQDQDPHPSPNTPNMEDSLLNVPDQPVDGPFNPLPLQSNLQLAQACSDQRSQQWSILALTRTSAVRIMPSHPTFSYLLQDLLS